MSRLENALDLVVRAAQLGQYDSNVIGMAAEIIAEEKFGMIKTPRGSRDVDGSWYVDGLEHTVQVKAWSEARVARYRQGTYLRLKEDALPDILLCILVYCSNPGYQVIYSGPPSEVGYVEKNRPSRVIRFNHMRSAEEIGSILRDLGIDEPIRLRVPKIPRERVPQVPNSDDAFRKLCAVCGESLGIDQFTYGNRSTNSYCKTCRKLVGAAYNRAGPEAATRFREEMRSKWKFKT